MKKLYLIDIDGSRAAVSAVLAAGILEDYATSNGLGGGVGAGQLFGICTAPWKPLEKAITTDKSPLLGTVYRFAAGKGSCNITPLETAGAVAEARRLVQAGRQRGRRRRR